MQPSTARDNGDGEEDWVVLSPSEIPPHQTDLHSENVYLNFQLRTRFGTFSISAKAKDEQINRDTKTQHDESINSQEQSPLFRLPAELRLNVYELILRIPRPTAATSSAAVELTHHPARSRTPTSLCILLTCRLALAEAEPLFYTLNRLSCTQPKQWYNSLGPRRRAAVTKLTLSASSPGSTYALLQDVAHFENLKSVWLERKGSARFQSVAAWRVMERQIVGVLRGMGTLDDVRVLMPGMERVVSEEERRREREMGVVDGRICGVVKGRS